MAGTPHSGGKRVLSDVEGPTHSKAARRTAVLPQSTNTAALRLGVCGRLDTILFDPPTAPEQWCKTRPCVELGGVVLDQPLGTFLVYLLADCWQAGTSGETAGRRSPVSGGPVR